MRIGRGPKWLHSYKGRTWDHKVAADRCCFEYSWWCSWVSHSSKKVQVLSGAETSLRPGPHWPPNSIFVCLIHDYSIIILICHQIKYPIMCKLHNRMDKMLGQSILPFIFPKGKFYQRSTIGPILWKPRKWAFLVSWLTFSVSTCYQFG